MHFCEIYVLVPIVPSWLGECAHKWFFSWNLLILYHWGILKHRKDMYRFVVQEYLAFILELCLSGNCLLLHMFTLVESCLIGTHSTSFLFLLYEYVNMTHPIAASKGMPFCKFYSANERQILTLTINVFKIV